MLAQARDDFDKWHAYNTRLIETLFTDRREADRYSANYGSITFLDMTLQDHIAEFRGRVAERIVLLESVIEQLELAREPDVSTPDPSSRAASAPGASSGGVPQFAEDRRAVFVVHGRNEPARIALFTFLRAIGLHPLEWSEAVAATGAASPYVGEILDHAFARAQAVVVLLTPDDEGRLREEFHHASDPPHETQLTGQARQNVIFEAGMALGRFPDRTVLVELGALRPFSDIGGRHVIRLNDSVARRQDLAQRLQTAGCLVNLRGTDWHTTGSFA